MKWKTPYNHDTDAESLASALSCKDPSKTQQSAAEESDINTIVNRFLKTGLLPNIQLPAHFGDFTNQVTDYLTAQNQIAETNALFYRLPAAVRASYQNDAAQWQEDVITRLDTGDLQPLKEMGLDLTNLTQTEPRATGGPPAPDTQAPAPTPETGPSGA